MKRIVSVSLLCFTLAVLGTCAVSAQERFSKPLESDIRLGAGLFAETGNHADKPGIALRVSYGLDIKINDRWSLMPGAGLKTQVSDIRHFGCIGGDLDQMSAADLFLDVRYRAAGKAVFSLGPQVSYMISPDTYYIDADPRDPLNGKEKFYRWDIGLRPGLVFNVGEHRYWGFEALIGLRNMLRPYDFSARTQGSIYLHNLMFVYGWHF